MQLFIERSYKPKCGNKSETEKKTSLFIPAPIVPCTVPGSGIPLLYQSTSFLIPFLHLKELEREMTVREKETNKKVREGEKEHHQAVAKGMTRKPYQISLHYIYANCSYYVNCGHNAVAQTRRILMYR